MDFSHFSDVLAACTALPAQKRLEIEQVAKTLDPLRLTAFSDEITSLNVRMAALDGEEAVIVEALDRFLRKGTRKLTKDDRVRRERDEQREDEARIDSLLRQ